MTTILETAALSATDVVAGQVRAELARRRMTHRELATATSRSHTYWWRRLTGEVAFDVADLATVASLLDVPFSTLVAPLDGPGKGRDPMVE